MRNAEQNKMMHGNLKENYMKKIGLSICVIAMACLFAGYSYWIILNPLFSFTVAVAIWICFLVAQIGMVCGVFYVYEK